MNMTFLFSFRPLYSFTAYIQARIIAATINIIIIILVLQLTRHRPPPPAVVHLHVNNVTHPWSTL